MSIFHFFLNVQFDLQFAASNSPLAIRGPQFLKRILKNAKKNCQIGGVNSLPPLCCVLRDLT
jgi:hypothetical protein